MRWRSLFAVMGVGLVAGCGGGSHVHISVDRPVVLWDAPLRITVSGLRPGGHAVLQATSRDEQGAKYVSSTAVTANPAGRVELTGDAAMRPLWSLRPVGLKTGVNFFFDAPSSGARIVLSVAGTRTAIRRLLAARGVHGTPVRHPFYGEYYAPATTRTRRPGILIFGGSEGGLATTGIAELYASHGYPSLALAYFAEPGLPHNLARIPLEYFATALRWLRQQPGVDPTKLAVEGISRGSEAAQLVGIHYPRLVHAVLAMVPSNGPVCGIKRITTTTGGAQCIGSAWTFHGKPLPWAFGAATPYPFHDERIAGPILLTCGGADEVWSSCPMAHAIVQRLRAHHFRHAITLLDYPQAGHDVGSLYPNTNYRDGRGDGLNPDSNNEAAANGWPKLLHFLNTFAHN